jgi:hypothetical protein
MELHNDVLGTMSLGQWPADTRFQAKPGFALREVCGEWLTIPVALAPEEASRMAVLNEEGKFLWELLGCDRSLQELVTAMTDTYEVSPEEACRDLIDFLTEMDKHALLLIKSEVEL